MKDAVLTHFRATRWFYLFISIHLLCWTLVPIIVRYNLPLDSIEGTIWGHQLEWGYDKNPFLNGWLTAFAIYLGWLISSVTHIGDGTSGWMVYLFSQISVVACFWAIWRLAKNMLSPAYALISVMLLEGLQYYNFHSIDFNDNTLELGLWGLAIYFFYRALRTPSTWYWMLTGCFAGLGMMAKYYTAALLAAMAIFLFWHADNRKQLITFAPYTGLLVFLAIILPHTIWLFFHEFITVTYVFDRASSEPSWTNHFFFPAQFTWQQVQVFLPAIALFGLVLLGKRPALARPKTSLNKFDRDFLFFVGLGPFLLNVLLSFVLGIKLRAGWGMPLLSCWGIILVALVQPYLTRAKLLRFIAGIYIFMALLLTGYTISLIDSPDESSANFPGHEIAQHIIQIWHEKYHTPLSYVAGSRWVGGNIELYGADHPSVFIEWDKRKAPWIDVIDMQKKGAIFVWSITDHEFLPAEIQKQYPQLQTPMILEFDWKRNHHHIPPIKIGIAILPPQTEVKK